MESVSYDYAIKILYAKPGFLSNKYVKELSIIACICRSNVTSTLQYFPVVGSLLNKLNDAGEEFAVVGDTNIAFSSSLNSDLNIMSDKLSTNNPRNSQLSH